MALNTTVHADYARNIHQWVKNKDAANDRIHDGKEKYLPANLLPDAALTNQSNIQLQEYLKHKYNTQIWPMSVFFDFTRPTISARIGMIMMKRPTVQFTDVIDRDTPLDYLHFNADGAGNGLVNVARLMLEAIDQTGGGFLLAQCPEQTPTVQSLRDGTIAPRMFVYDRTNVLDWDEAFVTSSKKLTYIKLREYESYSDGSTSEIIEKHIEYRLDENGLVNYTITRDQSYDGLPAIEEGELIESGVRATEIPGSWFGASDNESGVDGAPITPLANLNVLHYQVYSRHIQQVYDAGQGQYHIDLGSMDTLDSYDEAGNKLNPIEVLNPGGLKAGSLAPMVTANGGKVTLLQLSTDSLLAQEPEKIEDRALKIGAQMISDTADNTATEARINFGASTASLTTISENVSSAMLTEIKRIARTVKHDETKVQFELNKKFITESLTAQDRASFMQLVIQGTYPLKALYRVLKRAGEVAEEMEYEDFLQSIEEDAAFFDLLGKGTKVSGEGEQ